MRGPLIPVMHFRMNALREYCRSPRCCLGHFIVDLMVRSVGKEAETMKEFSTSNEDGTENWYRTSTLEGK